MPEIKHTFTAGKMNKDLDERLVPNGEYRDAMNIQVRTTSGEDGVGDAGTVQNLQGNTNVTGESIHGDINTICVASIGNEKNDKAYFFFTNGDSQGIEQVASGPNYYIDSIIEQDANTDATVPVVVDFFALTDTFANVFPVAGNAPDGSSTAWTVITFPTTTASFLRVNMTLKALGDDGSNLTPGAKIRSINTGTGAVTLYNEQSVNLQSGCSAFVFQHERALNFPLDVGSKNKITGVNIIDDLLFWTDNLNEPKKINIKRSIEGTASFTSHTQLLVTDPLAADNVFSSSEFVNPSFFTSTANNDLLEEHITVIKKAPRTPITIHVENRNEILSNISITAQFAYSGFSPSTGTTYGFSNVAFSDSNYVIGDILKLELESDNEVSITASFTSYIDGANNVSYPTDSINIEVVSIEGNIPIGEVDWIIAVDVDIKKPLFEIKFPRFGYRYKYEDGEYSSFSPWSEIAFEPGGYDYDAKKGYNLGMVNNIVEFKLKDFIPVYTQRPLDVVAVDILFKSEGSPNVYTVKTVTRGKDLEWELFTGLNTLTSEFETGEISITSEMIHNALPSNQILRAWDNVPRYALAQEISANRLIYGNYVQGYDIKYPVGLIQNISSSDIAAPSNPQRSVKTIRNYKWGMVFGDKYGRETPVLSSSYVIGSTDAGNLTSTTGDVIVEKNLCALKNSFTLKQSWSTPGGGSSNGAPENWMEYVKYYVKETSNEYYNLALDRWYYAENDDNLWLSFPSADRNKVDEETYLVLKKEHGTENAVIEPARYKIISIENEAPDYIKIDRRTMGEVQLPLGTSGSPEFIGLTTATSITTQPTALMTSKSIVFTNGNWEGFLDNYVKRGELKIRVIGRLTDSSGNTLQEIKSSEFITLNNFRQKTTPSGDWEVFFEESLNQNANMLTQFTTLYGSSALTGNTIEYFVEFQEEVVENKPEFDGRFFVLIERNDILQEKVEKLTGLEINYVDAEQFVIAYVDSQENNPGNSGNGTFGGDTADWFNAFSTGNGPMPNETFSPIWMGMGCSGYGQNTSIQTTNFDSINAGVQTSNFWASFDAYHNETNAHRVYIDGARWAYGYYDQTDYLQQDGVPGQYTSPPNDPDPEWYKPTALDQGGAASGLGRMVLSQNASGSLGDQQAWNNDTEAGGSVGYDTLRNAMMSVDTMFRFADDQSNTIYRVVGTPIQTQKVHNYQNGYNGNNYPPEFNGNVITGINDNSIYNLFNSIINDVSAGDQEQCEPCNWVSQAHCNRSSIIFEFRKVDKDTDLTTDDGINTGIFDPRSHLPHDGSGTINIILVKKSFSSGSKIVPDEDRAIWETEPKEDVGLDIYYEASHAIPMKLKENNMLSFASIGSDIVISRDFNSSSSEINIEASENGYEDSLYTNHRLANMLFTADSFYALITSLNTTTGATAAHVTNIGIGDYIDFKHKSGTQTRTKILDHVSGTAPHLPVTRLDNRTITINLGTDPQTVAISNISGVTTGMNIIGVGADEDNVPSGMFVFNYSDDDGANNLQLSEDAALWMTAGQSYSVELMTPTGYYEIDQDIYKYRVKLGWHNCWSFGNGVESDRVRDDFNAATVDNGVKVSTTFTSYGKETKASGMIYSGIYNSTSGVNDLNEFNMAEKITKDLNPSYGSIQAMKTRDRDVVVFTEDKVMKVLSNKDAVFNADGNPQLVATNRVLGEAIPFSGDYGISKNPESLAVDNYRMYFTDVQRGAVLRLSMDGLTPISNVGMKSWFRENLKSNRSILGTFDVVNGEYNITMDSITGNDKTISFNEGSKGWVSFKSFLPKEGLSVSGTYLTAFDNKIYKHYSNVDSNTFYDEFADSSITVMFNDMPSTVKSFKTINYEGSQARINQFTTVTQDGVTYTDAEYYNIFPNKLGWFVSDFRTDMQDGKVYDFIDKENKWFNKVCGQATTLNNLDPNEFTVQGIGSPNAAPVITYDEVVEEVIVEDVVVPDPSEFTLTIKNE